MDTNLESLSRDILLKRCASQEEIISRQQNEIEHLKKENSIFKELFDYSPTPMWEEDITELINYLETLKKKNIIDFDSYFRSHPEELQSCIKKIELLNVNRATVNMHRAESKKELVDNWDKLLTEKSLSSFAREISAIADGLKNYEIDTEARTFKNNIIDLRLYLKIIERVEENRTRYYALVSTVDTTVLRRTESALYESEQSLKAILNASKDIIFLVDKNAKLIVVNDALLDLLNARKVDLIGRDLRRYYGEKNHKERMEVINKILWEKKPIYYRESSFNRTWETSCYPVFDDRDRVTSVAFYQKDITRQLRSEERIKTNEERLQLVLKAAKLSWWEVNLLSDHIEKSNYWYKKLGYGLHEIADSLDFYYSLVHPDDKSLVKDSLESLRDGIEENSTFEYRVRDKNGNYRWIYTWLKTIEWDIAGNPFRIVGVNMDITERKIAQENEEMLLESYSGIFNNSIDAIYILDEEARFITVNNAAEKMYGYSKDTLIGKSAEFVAAPGKNDTVKLYDYLRRAFQGERIEIDFWGIRSNGEEFPKIVRLSNVKYMGRNAVVAFGLDITDRHIADQELIKSEERYRTIFNHVPLSITQIDHEGIIEKINDYHLSKIAKGRRSIDDFVGTNILERDSIIKANVIEYYKSLLNGKPFELSEIYFPTTTGGESAYFNLRGVPLFNANELIGAIITTEDVTEIVKNRQKLSEAETRLSLALEGATIGFWDNDLQTGKVWRSNQWFEMLGYSSEQFGNDITVWHNLIHPDDLKYTFDAVELHTKGYTKELKIEHRLKNSQNRYQWILNWGKIIDRDENGKPLRAAGIHMDITDKKNAELELLESEKKYSSLVEQSNEGIIINQDWKIKYCNKYVLKILGYSMDEIIDAPVHKFLSNDSIKDVKSKYESRIAGLNTQALYESVAITKNGKEIPIEVNSALMEYRGKPATQSIVRVITERKIAEAALKESEERFKQLFNNMGSGVSIYEPVNEGKDFKLIAINNAGEKLRGITSEKSLGRKITALLPDVKINGMWDIMFEVYSSGIPAKHPIKKIIDNQIAEWIDNYIYKLPSGQIVIIYDDRSGEKMALESLKNSEEKLRNLYRHMNDIREEERKKIAREVHDNLGQKLTALNLNISWISQNIPKEMIELKDNFTSVLDLINQSILTVQKISTELRPGILDDLGLANAIQWQSNEISRRSNLKFKLSLEEKDHILNDNIKTQLYRVFQEALTNIIRHAAAENVTVNLQFSRKKLIFEIADDGIGTDMIQIDNSKSFGIIGMKERVASINGKFRFTTKPKKGTKIKISIPL